METFLDFYKAVLLPFTIGITSSVVTLVGLISIFISITTQHQLQRINEIIWDFITLDSRIRRISHDKDKLYEESLKIIEKFNLLYSLNKNSNNRLTDTVIYLSISSLMVVVIGWLFLALVPYNYTNGKFIILLVISLIGIIILLLFIYVLIKLKNFRKFINPNLEAILDAEKNSDSGINNLVIFAFLLDVTVNDHFDHYELGITVPYKFNNIGVDISIINYGTAPKEMYNHYGNTEEGKAIIERYEKRKGSSLQKIISVDEFNVLERKMFFSGKTYILFMDDIDISKDTSKVEFIIRLSNKSNNKSAYITYRKDNLNRDNIGLTPIKIRTFDRSEI